MINENKSGNRFAKRIIFLLSIFLVIVLGLLWFLGSDEKKSLDEPKETSDRVISIQKKVAFVRFVDDKPHLIFDGRDLGEMANQYFEFSEGNLVFERKVAEDNHIIYNEKDLGSGFRPMLSGKNLAFYRKIGEETHLIYNGNDLGAIFMDNGYSAKIAGSNLVFEKMINDKTHILYNNTDLGEGHSPMLSKDGKNVAFERDMEQGSVVIYNEQVFDKGGSIFALDEKHVWYALPQASNFFSMIASEGVLSLPGISKNAEKIGDGIGLKCDEGNCAYQSIIDGKLHFIYNEKNLGEMSDTGNEYGLSKNNYFFIRPGDNGDSVIIYNGKELGQGSDPVIGEAGFAYLKSIEGTKHVIYNDKDMGEGLSPFLSPDGKTLVFIKEIDGKKHVLFEGNDLGEINGEQIILKVSN